jgi:drug/metabolite transporter (DMT)-like permease
MMQAWRRGWLGLVLVGAPLNVLVNLGYKFATSANSVVWLACVTMAVAAVTLLSFALVTKRQGWDLLRQPRLAGLVGVTGLAGCAVFLCFLTALKDGPISLVDPLWACVYALVSLTVGMLMVRERPALGAMGGIGLYMAGAALMGLGAHQGDSNAGWWMLLVLVGASLNVFINLMFKMYAAKLDKVILVGAVYTVTVLGLGLWGSVAAPEAWQGLLEGSVPLIVLGMGVGIPVFMLVLVTALVRGPISIVDPLWACLYGLGSVLVGMLLLGEAPTMVALLGVGVYLLGAVLMGYFGRRVERPR